MPELTGFDRVILSFRDRARRAGKARTSLMVGYSAPYAVYVHEDLQARHTNGQAKYLEQPQREYAERMALMVRESVARGKPLQEALLEAGNFLLEESRKLVPVDTGRLKASGFVKVEG